MIKRLIEFFSSDIGIDLGTANTLVYVKGRGIVVNEPSVVAINTKTDKVVAVGYDAKKMLGRTPQHIKAIRPLVDGVISNFEIAEEMIAYFIRKAEKNSKNKILRSRVIIGVPSGITNVERRAVSDAAKNAGARIVHIIEEPMSAALGIKLPIEDPVGSMIIDIGGGTTDIAVISLSGIVISKNLRIAGDKLNEDIISYIRDEFKISIGEKTAEEVKNIIGSVHKGKDVMEATVRGRDLVTGLPREVIITDSDIREAISTSISTFVDSVKEVLESTPPEIISDIMHRGIVLVGGGSLIHGLVPLLEKELAIPIYIADDPMTSVVRGMGVVLENIGNYKEFLFKDEEKIPPVF